MLPGHHDRYDAADFDPPHEVFIVGACTTCGSPVAHEPGLDGAYCDNPTCEQSFEAAERRAVSTGLADPDPTEPTMEVAA